jgi:hypothetical protein
MRAMHKHKLPDYGLFNIETHLGAKVLSAQVQQGKSCWLSILRTLRRCSSRMAFMSFIFTRPKMAKVALRARLRARAGVERETW